jgi:hypothetical protein
MMTPSERRHLGEEIGRLADRFHDYEGHVPAAMIQALHELAPSGVDIFKTGAKLAKPEQVVVLKRYLEHFASLGFERPVVDFDDPRFEEPARLLKEGWGECQEGRFFLFPQPGKPGWLQCLELRPDGGRAIISYMPNAVGHTLDADRVDRDPQGNITWDSD